MAHSLKHSKILRILEAKPFTPHPLLPTADLQSIASLSFPYFKDRRWKTQRELVPISKDTAIAADFSLQEQPQDHPTIIIVPGIYGVSDTPILLAIGHKAFHAGYNVVRLNLPNQSGTAHLTNKYYYIGQSEVVLGTVQALVVRKLKNIFLVGISYGGNICAKAVGEIGEQARQYIRGLALLSPAIDPLASLRHTEQQRNPIYERSIVYGLNKLNKARWLSDPKNFPYSPQKTIRAWTDTHMTAAEPIGWGFKDSDDYLSRNSALPLMANIKVPTLIIQAKDDPLVPFDPFLSEKVTGNPAITFLPTAKGGHCGFIAKKKYPGDLDLRWDQNRALEFFNLLNNE